MFYSISRKPTLRITKFVHFIQLCFYSIIEKGWRKGAGSVDQIQRTKKSKNYCMTENAKSIKPKKWKVLSQDQHIAHLTPRIIGTVCYP